MFGESSPGMRNAASGTAETAGRTWKLLGAAAAFCGTAAYLFSTDTGRRLLTTVQDRVLNLYGQASHQVSSGYSSIRDRIRGMASSEPLSDEADFESRVRKLQDKFRQVV